MGLAMTEVVEGWSRFAGGAVVVDGVYCGTVITVPYSEKIPHFRGNGGFRIKFVRPYTPSGY